MIGRGVFGFTLFLLISFKDVTSIRDVRLTVEPSIVTRGKTAALICSRDMENASLYSVKWYRGNHEFYRYTPNETPVTRVFGLPGIYVDMNRSNGSQVQLRKLEPSLSGTFSCEVTAESPKFSTQIASKFVEIIAEPQGDPILKTNKDQYQPYEVMEGNCTSSPARPAANITIFVNGQPIYSSETSLHPSDSGFYWSNVKVELKITPDLFVGGRLRVSCMATVYDVYNRNATLDFFTPDTDPIPERITFNSSSSLHSCLLMLFLFIIPMIMSQEFFEDALADVQYYDEDSLQKAGASLVGG